MRLNIIELCLSLYLFYVGLYSDRSLLWKSYIMSIEYTCGFASNPIIVLIGSMNTQKECGWRLEEEIANAEAPPRGEQVPPHEEEANIDQAPVNPPPLTDGDIRAALFQLS